MKNKKKIFQNILVDDDDDDNDINKNHEHIEFDYSHFQRKLNKIPEPK